MILIKITLAVGAIVFLVALFCVVSLVVEAIIGPGF